MALIDKIKFRYRVITALFFTSLGLLSSGQTTIPMEQQYWETYQNTKSKFEIFEDVPTLKLEGKIFVKGLDLHQGTLEVDVFANAKRSFAGIIFRKNDHNMEDVYMRTHKSGQPDAVQYTPIYNGESNWQLYKEYQAQLVFKQSGWNKLKISFKDSIADVYVNDVKVLTIDELRSGNISGSIGLFSLFENRFANFRYNMEINNITLPDKKEALPDSKGLIKEWFITKALDFNNQTLDFKNIEKLSYQKVIAEKSGLLPISKYLRRPNFGNFEENSETYTVAKYEWSESNKTNKTFSFDYSDKIMVFLNGVLIFKGNNAFRSKGVQFMGHLDIESNKLMLPLRKGKNTIHCIVIEQANGWGLTGRIE